MSSLYINLDEIRNLYRKKNTRNYRLLTIYEKDKDSCILNFKEELPNDEVKKKKKIYNNEKGTYEKHKSSHRSSLYIEEYGKNNEKNKSDIIETKKYLAFEKKIFKELDYKDYLKNIKEIEDKEYKKVSRKKRTKRIILLLLFFLVLMIPLIDFSLEKFIDGGLLGLLGLLYLKKNGDAQSIEGLLSTLFEIGGWGNSDKILAGTIFFYCAPFLIFVVIFILGMIHYYKKVIKYENMKFKKKINKK
ncbi:Plasmodium exported protein (Pm-fam-a like), unknown function [Plasmodium malariae]|uniref:Fam-l protein n=1 Tax=Plasmodium malariae TaxID=5858 RepID=A0A1A8X475_PLAMA|nr:Plasmodium exported protein (Pm-fam-a like), unknown function [Plasmodium malariae]